MPDFLPSRSYPLGRGLNLDDAPESIDDSEALELVNFRFEGRGRWTTRRAAAAVVSGLVDPCGVFGMPHGELASGDPAAVVYLDWDQNQVKLYKGSGRTDSLELVGVPKGWNSAAARPQVQGAVLAGCLWLTDIDRQLGLTCYDPTDVFGQGVFFQPLFKFDQTLDTPAGRLFARDVTAYNNFLFVCGHGTEAEPDQPEIVRFSYLGLAGPDADATSDAALDVTQVNPDYDPLLPIGPGNQPYLLVEGGVEGLFDVADYFPVGQRGIPVMGMQQGAERLVICTRLKAYINFGYDRNSFELDLLDGQRGLVATQAMGEADGVVYWMSPLGPTRWAGGSVKPMNSRVRPLIRKITNEKMFFFHQPQEYEARWYFSNDGGDPNRSLSYSYLFDEWRRDELGVRVSCGGHSIPGSILRAGPGGAPLPPGPGTLAAPRNAHCEDHGSNQLTVVWTPGETGPDIITEFSFRKDSETIYSTIEELPSTTDRKVVTGLDPNTQYWFKLTHRSLSGETSADTIHTCTTLQASTLTQPAALDGAILEIFDLKHDLVAWRLKATWLSGQETSGDQAVDTEVELRNLKTGDLIEARVPSGTAHFLAFYSDEGFQNVAEHPEFFLYPNVFADDGNFQVQWRVRVRHITVDDSKVSEWTDEEVVDADSPSFVIIHDW